MGTISTAIMNMSVRSKDEDIQDLKTLIKSKVFDCGRAGNGSFDVYITALGSKHNGTYDFEFYLDRYLLSSQGIFKDDKNVSLTEALVGKIIFCDIIDKCSSLKSILDKRGLKAEKYVKTGFGIPDYYEGESFGTTEYTRGSRLIERK